MAHKSSLWNSEVFKVTVYYETTLKINYINIFMIRQSSKAPILLPIIIANSGKGDEAAGQF
jgi:hypothetical protein